MQPAISKLDPHLIHRAKNQLDIAARYGRTMMEMRNVDVGIAKAGDHRAIIKRLVWGYPAHSFVISRDEARNMGLPVTDVAKHPRWELIRRFYEAFCTELEQDDHPPRTMLLALSDDELVTKIDEHDTKGADPDGNGQADDIEGREPGPGSILPKEPQGSSRVEGS